MTRTLNVPSFRMLPALKLGKGDSVLVGFGRLLEELVALGVLDLEGYGGRRARCTSALEQRKRPQIDDLAGLVDGFIVPSRAASARCRPR